MTASALLSARPRLRPEIRLGPPLVAGKAVVHHLKDPRTGWYFRVGVREFFVISRLDGERTVADIGAEYTHEFGKRLHDEHWQRIFGMLGGRRLLAGMDDPQVLAELAEAARRGGRGGQNLLLYRRPLVNPDRLLGWLEPRLRFAFSPWFVIPAAAAILAMLAELALRWPAVYSDTRHGWGNGWILGVSIAIVWAGLAVHETAHGLACKHFGGSANEIGVIWRFPILAPYCRADDVVLFWPRRHRVCTAFAGIFAGLVTALPFAALWLIAPPGSAPRFLAAAVTLFSAAAALLNLLPFLQLDGYFMLNHALGMSNLRQESYRFIGRLATGVFRRRNPAGGYRRWVRLTYLLYGGGSLLYGAVLAVRVSVTWYRPLSHGVGATGAAVTLPAVAALFAAAAVLSMRRARRKQAALPTAVAASGSGRPELQANGGGAS
jgi:putative peptide zinc metalloprotease protein